MAISHLEVTDFRNFQTLTIHPSQGFNWIVGANGSGKTSLLEAVHLLATSKSFRTLAPRHYVRRGSRACVVFGRLLDTDSPERSVGVSRDLSGVFSGHINGERLTRLSELARHFPVVTLLPDSVEIIEGEPAHRREFLDWTMFHVEHPQEYLYVYRAYGRLLQQRNQLLKGLQSGESRRAGWRQTLDTWDAQLAEHGERLSECRQHFVETHLMHLTGPDGGELGQDVELIYQRGWPADVSLLEVLKSSLDRDVERGSTQYGPHRFDLRFSVGGVSAKDFLSRGQKKHLVARLKIKQIEIFLGQHPRDRIIFLGDDVFSELDDLHAGSLFHRLRSLGVQTFATSIEPPENKGFLDRDRDKLFHVEHGVITSPKSPEPS